MIERHAESRLFTSRRSLVRHVVMRTLRYVYTHMIASRMSPIMGPNVIDRYTIATTISTNTGVSEKSKYSKKLLSAVPRSRVRISSPVLRRVWYDMDRFSTRSNMRRLMCMSEYHEIGYHSRFCATFSKPPVPWNSLSAAKKRIGSHGSLCVLSASTTRPSAIGTSRLTRRPRNKRPTHDNAKSCSFGDSDGHRYGNRTRTRDSSELKEADGAAGAAGAAWGTYDTRWHSATYRRSGYRRSARTATTPT